MRPPASASAPRISLQELPDARIDELLGLNKKKRERKKLKQDAGAAAAARQTRHSLPSSSEAGPWAAEGAEREPRRHSLPAPAPVGGGGGGGGASSSGGGDRGGDRGGGVPKYSEAVLSGTSRASRAEMAARAAAAAPASPAGPKPSQPPQPQEAEAAAGAAAGTGASTHPGTHVGRGHPKQTWVSCDECEKWRRVVLATSGTKERVARRKAWKCGDNSDARYSSCDTPQVSRAG